MRRLRFAFLVSAFTVCFISPFASAQGLPPAVAQALRQAQIPSSSVSVVVQGVHSRTPELSHNAAAAMNPASVMKLVTTYAALDILGPASTWKTTAWRDAEVQDGVLKGNLYLKGSGDPKLTMEQFWLLLRQIRQRGIRDIQGDVILDRSQFNLPPHDPSAFDDKPLRPYNVGPDALLTNFRAQRYTLAPGAGKVEVWVETPSENLRLDNRLQLTNGACGEWRENISVRVLLENNPNNPSVPYRLELSGTYPQSCGEKPLNVVGLPADAQIDGLFRALWRELGGSVRGRFRAGTTPSTATLAGQIDSAAVSDMVKDINKFSNNVMARQLFLSLGYSQGRPATLEAAQQRVVEWLQQRGLRFPEFVIENGSGLSRQERISAESLNRLLQDAWRSQVMPELIASMPIVGMDGTMKKRLQDSEAKGRAHIKTGTLDGVKAAAGFALDAKGQNYVTIFLINHPRAVLAQPAIDALLLWIAQGEGRSTERQNSN